MRRRNRRNRFRFGADNGANGRAIAPSLVGIALSWVQCKEHRCLAYRDPAGKWINFYTGKGLTGFVKVIE